MNTSETKQMINKFLSLILSTFKAKHEYLDLKTHWEEKCDDIKQIESRISAKERQKQKSFDEQYRYEKSLHASKLSIADPILYKQRMHDYRFDRRVCDDEIVRLTNRRNELIKVCNARKIEKDSKYAKYESLNSSLNSFCSILNERDLKNIIEYFDLTIDSNVKSKNDIIDSIIKSIIDDIKLIYLHVPEFFSANVYKGTISFIEMILEYKNNCEHDIKKHRDVEKSLLEHELTERILLNSHLKLVKKKEELESSIFNVIFRKKLIEQLDTEGYNVYVEVTKLSSKKQQLVEKFEKTKEEKNISYAHYKDRRFLIPVLINKLGERSLRKLLETINISVPTTDDNYFDEIGEMKNLLKKWFEKENKRLDMQFEKEDRVEIVIGEPKKLLRKY